MSSDDEQSWYKLPAREVSVAADDRLFEAGAVVRALGGAAQLGSADQVSPLDALSEHVRERYDVMLPRAKELIAPRLYWMGMHLRLRGGTAVCGEPRVGELAVGKIVANQIRECVAAAIFVVTVGDTLERIAREMIQAGEMLDGFILDALGSVAADACAEVVGEQVRDEVAPLGWQITNRFSPGYCTWATADQHTLFGMLHDEPAGVQLTDSALMHPIKSVSGIIGLGPQAAYEPYPCAFCGHTSCRQRLVESCL